MKYHKPAYPAESEVQAEFYRRCRNQEIEIHLEYRGDARCRFDCVIVRGGDIVCIVECKKTPQGAIPTNKRADAEQAARYGGFGVPLVYVRGLGDIERAYAEVRRIIAARSGGGWKKNRHSNAGLTAITGSRSVVLP